VIILIAAMADLVDGTTRYQGVDKQSAGYKLLASMGWSEGEGLVRPS
jgi:Pin2-interacting protein X1